MNGKITLITPPDIYENENISILFINLKEEDQELVSKWLADNNIDQNINLYVYNDELNITWLLYAVARADYSVINLTNMGEITQLYSSYLLGKNINYYTDNEHLAAMFTHINNNRIKNITSFLEGIFSG